MQAIFGDREHRTARRALRVEAWRGVLIDLALMAFAIGVALAVGAIGGGP